MGGIQWELASRKIIQLIETVVWKNETRYSHLLLEVGDAKLCVPIIKSAKPSMTQHCYFYLNFKIPIITL